MEHGEDARKPGKRRRDHVSDLLVASRSVADELRALLVFTDRNQDGPYRRSMESRQRKDYADADQCDEAVIDPAVFEIDAEPGRPRDAAESAFAAGHGRPPK